MIGRLFRSLLALAGMGLFLLPVVRNLPLDEARTLAGVGLMFLAASYAIAMASAFRRDPAWRGTWKENRNARGADLLRWGGACVLFLGLYAHLYLKLPVDPAIVFGLWGGGLIGAGALRRRANPSG